MEEEQLEALLVSEPKNRRYLTGFTGQDSDGDSAGSVIVTADRLILITDFRYEEQARHENPELEVVLKQPGLSRQANLTEAIGKVVGPSYLSRVGFESSHLVVRAYEELKTGLGEKIQLVPTTNLVEDLRAVKDEEEISRISMAAQIADRSLARLLESLHPGMTEKEASWELEKVIREEGAEDVAFDLIVASGPNGARPHAIPTSRPLEEGEPIVVDLGARYEGYASDMTRTVWLGEPTERLREIYSVVLKAQTEASSYLRAGRKGEEVDAVARDVITAAGYGQYFGHGLGHGVGLAVHEEPRLAKGSTDIIKENMAVTVEPGIYLPGWGGVRIEDLAIVKHQGIDVLTKAVKGGLP